MKFLLVAKQEKNAAAFLETLGCLVERGHQVTIAVQEHDEARNQRLAAQIPSERFCVVPCPAARMDEWASVAPLVRRLRDCIQYLRPPFAASSVLQTRMFHKLRQELGVDIEADALASGLRLVSGTQLDHLESVLRLAEHSLPTSALFDEFLAAQQPDVLLVSPLVHFGSAQADVAASGRRLGIPVWMLLYSWDNLSTKGCMHVQPDLMFVWNERQQIETAQLHRFPAARVVVVGAPRFDRFFTLRPALSRQAFHEPLGLDPLRRTVLYLCSSRLIAPQELEFVTRWLAALRSSRSAVLRECNVVIRPHPDVALLPESARFVRQSWAGAPRLDSQVATPFEDRRTVVLRTSSKDPDGLYESLAHCNAVVGLNTTAELEAGIVGRPVFSIMPGDGEAAAQQATVHFQYLTRAQGGFVSVASTIDEHLAQLEEALAGDMDPAPIRAFIQSFLRPHGIDRPVAPLLADALERHAAAPVERAHAVPPPALHVEHDAPAAGDGAVVPLAYKRARVVVHATAEAVRHTVNGAIPLDRTTLAWLEQSVHAGDVVYDVNAGFGAYALIAARQRGAVVVAFEPGYKVYAALCDNVLLNGCEASVIPVPLPLTDRDALGYLRYQRGHPGKERYIVQNMRWRMRPPQPNQPYAQPVCATRLDTVVERYGLPRAKHVRVSRLVPVIELLEGATRTLVDPLLQTLCVAVSSRDEVAVVERLGGLGLRVAGRTVGRKAIHIVFGRDAAVLHATSSAGAAPQGR
jgi:FkbM family methyltransferase